MGAYFVLTVLYAFFSENYATLPFLMLFVVGFIYTGVMSLCQNNFTRFLSSKIPD